MRATQKLGRGREVRSNLYINRSRLSRQDRSRTRRIRGPVGRGGIRGVRWRATVRISRFFRFLTTSNAVLHAVQSRWLLAGCAPVWSARALPAKPPRVPLPTALPGQLVSTSRPGSAVKRDTFWLSLAVQVVKRQLLARRRTCSRELRGDASVNPHIPGPESCTCARSTRPAAKAPHEFRSL